MPRKIIIQKWEKYWRLTLTWNDKYERRWKRNDRVRFVECKCNCWNTIWVLLTSLRRWNTISCWCYQSEQAAKAIVKHSKTHWESKTVFYRIYKSLRSRCNNTHIEKYKDYWGRGIKCEWNSFEEFKNDMMPSYKEWLTIDRIDVNWNYSKENCRWVTRKVQANNKRNNRYFDYEWKRYTLQELSELSWIKPWTISFRLKKWWDLKKAITEPLLKYN